MYARHLARLQIGHRRVIEPWYHWDAVWYAEISREGYFYAPGRMSSVAFFPLLPLLMDGAAISGVDRYWAGLVLPNLAFAFGLACFSQVAASATGDRAAGVRACVLLAVYPWSFFYSAPYQESFGFALTAAALWAWVARRPVLTGTFLGLATTARLFAAGLSAAVLSEWVADVLRRRRGRRGAWLVATIGLSGAGVYFSYLALRFGEPLASLKTQVAWGRRPAGLLNLWDVALAAGRHLECNPLQAAMLVGLAVWIGRDLLFRALSRISRPAARVAAVAGPACLFVGVINVIAYCALDPSDYFMWNYQYRYGGDSLDLVVLVLFLLLGLRAWVRRGVFWAVLALAPILMAAATGSLTSLGRLALSSFPAFIELAEVCHHRASFGAAVLLMLFFQLVLLHNYVNWSFSG